MVEGHGPLFNTNISKNSNRVVFIRFSCIYTTKVLLTSPQTCCFCVYCRPTYQLSNKAQFNRNLTKHTDINIRWLNEFEVDTVTCIK